MVLRLVWENPTRPLGKDAIQDHLQIMQKNPGTQLIISLATTTNDEGQAKGCADRFGTVASCSPTSTPAIGSPMY